MFGNSRFHKRIVILSGAIILIGFIWFLFTPQKVFSNPSMLEYASVYFHDQYISVDSYELGTIISKYNFQRKIEPVGRIELDLVTFRVDFDYNHHPIHIYLGDLNFMTRGDSYWDYNIRDAQKLKDEVEDLIQSSDVTDTE